jgi:hypothetical protein
VEKKQPPRRRAKSPPPPALPAPHAVRAGAHHVPLPRCLGASPPTPRLASPREACALSSAPSHHVELSVDQLQAKLLAACSLRQPDGPTVMVGLLRARAYAAPRPRCRPLASQRPHPPPHRSAQVGILSAAADAACSQHPDRSALSRCYQCSLVCTATSVRRHRTPRRHGRRRSARG